MSIKSNANEPSLSGDEKYKEHDDKFNKTMRHERSRTFDANLDNYSKQKHILKPRIEEGIQLNGNIEYSNLNKFNLTLLIENPKGVGQLPPKAPLKNIEIANQDSYLNSRINDEDKKIDWKLNNSK